MPESEARRSLRERLAQHFVQRRRPDIKEWKDTTVFPDRETREATYAITGAWARLFDDVLAFAREMVGRTKDESALRQRMSWWAALALLRCISSSPAAAALALRTRLKATIEGTEADQLAEIEEIAADTVLDGADDETLTADETVPAGTTEDAAQGRQTARRHDRPRRSAARRETRPEAGALLRQELERLVAAGFRPVVFCRYIATAHYLFRTTGRCARPQGRRGAGGHRRADAGGARRAHPPVRRRWPTTRRRC